MLANIPLLSWINSGSQYYTIFNNISRVDNLTSIYINIYRFNYFLECILLSVDLYCLVSLWMFIPYNSRVIYIYVTPTTEYVTFPLETPVMQQMTF